MEDHANYGVDFIFVVKTIKEQCSYVNISGGTSNLSFRYRGVTKIWESIHSVFLRHAILESGLDIFIVNSNEMLGLGKVEDDMKIILENLVLNKTEEATDKMLARSNYECACIEAKK